MERLLIRNGFVVDSGSGIFGVRDVLTEGARVVEVARDIRTRVKTIDAEGKIVSPGFIDLQFNPGKTIERASGEALRSGITTPLIMPCNVEGKTFLDYYGGLEKMLEACEGLSTNIANAVSLEPEDTGSHETYIQLGVPIERLEERLAFFAGLGITSVGEVVLPLGGEAHITSDMSAEFLDALLDKTEGFDIPVLLHTGLGNGGITEAIRIASGRKLHICHIGSTVADGNLQKALLEVAAHDNITCDTHLSEVAGSNSRNSELVRHYYSRGEVYNIDPRTLEAHPVNDLENASPPFYYSKENLIENNIACALSEAVDAIESDDLGDGIRSGIMFRNVMKIADMVSLEAQRLKLLRKLLAKMTSGPAKILGLSARGSLKEGSFADIAILDPILQRVDTVLVNGRIALRDGKPTGIRAGVRVRYHE